MRLQGVQVAGYRAACWHEFISESLPSVDVRGHHARHATKYPPPSHESGGEHLDAHQARAVLSQGRRPHVRKWARDRAFSAQGVVQSGWLGERDFLVAVAVGMISPGPVVITATFVGYLVAGFCGSLAATVGIFLPSFILVLVAAPLVARHRTNRNLQGFVKGAYAAAIGTILGASVLLGRIAIGDWFTVLVCVTALVALFRWKLSNPLLMAITAAAGLIAYPLLHPAWVMVK
jgi:chromate transport protein ChrA